MLRAHDPHTPTGLQGVSEVSALKWNRSVGPGTGAGVQDERQELALKPQLLTKKSGQAVGGRGDDRGGVVQRGREGKEDERGER